MNTMFNDNLPSEAQYIVLDCEFLFDRPLYERYRARDAEPAPLRWPMRRIVSASVMAVTVSAGVLEITAFRSWSGRDEAKLLTALFGFLRDRPFAKIVTWAGISADVPVLRVAAQEHSLKLPRQLRSSVNSRSVHFDLAAAAKGGERNHVHLSEIATRQNVPFKMAGHAGSVPRLAEQGNFRAIEHMSEADVLTTAAVLCNWLAADGDLLSGRAAQLSILQFVRPIRGQAPYARTIGNMADRLRKEIAGEIDEFLRRAA